MGYILRLESIYQTLFLGILAINFLTLVLNVTAIAISTGVAKRGEDE
jgi:hypothetical protein